MNARDTQFFEGNTTKERYLNDIARHLLRAWRSEEQWKQCTVEFVLLKDGGVKDVHISKSSGLPSFDKAAIDIICAVARYRPIPNRFGVETLTLQCTFGRSLPKMVNVSEIAQKDDKSRTRFLTS